MSDIFLSLNFNSTQNEIYETKVPNKNIVSCIVQLYIKSLTLVDGAVLVL